MLFVVRQVDVTEITQQYQARDSVQGVIDVCKMLLTTLWRAIKYLAPVFGQGVPLVESIDAEELLGRPMTSDEEFCGTVGPNERIGNMALIEPSDEADPLAVEKTPITTVAGPEGVKLLCIARQAWLQVPVLVYSPRYKQCYVGAFVRACAVLTRNWLPEEL